jgi:hypothetical protein
MSDEYYQVKNIFEFIRDNLSILNEKSEQNIKALVRNSIIEKTLARFLFQYRSKEYELYNILSYIKENTDNSDNVDTIFPYIKEQLICLHKLDFKTGPLMFYWK